MIRPMLAIAFTAAGAFLVVPQAVAAEPKAETDLSARAGEAWDNLKSYTLDKKAEAVAYGKQLMKETDAKIAQLESKAAKAGGEAKLKLDQEIEALKAKRAGTSAKLDEMEKKSGGAWSEAKQGFADAYKDLQRAYDKVLARLK